MKIRDKHIESGIQHWIIKSCLFFFSVSLPHTHARSFNRFSTCFAFIQTNANLKCFYDWFDSTSDLKWLQNALHCVRMCSSSHVNWPECMCCVLNSNSKQTPLEILSKKRSIKHHFNISNFNGDLNNLTLFPTQNVLTILIDCHLNLS